MNHQLRTFRARRRTTSSAIPWNKSKQIRPLTSVEVVEKVNTYRYHFPLEEFSYEAEICHVTPYEHEKNVAEKIEIVIIVPAMME